jgi:flagellar biosynthesis protein FlhG
MKPLEEQNHYEALEISRYASVEEVERAYRVLRDSYGDESMALYSVFDPSDARTIRERIELAYQVLSDEQQRRDYDKSLWQSDPNLEEPAPLEEPSAPGPLSAPSGPLEQIEAFEDLEAEEGGEDFDGPRLRRARMRRGIEIEQVAGVTKINPTYLHFIEEESYDDLPAPVYVRGFVTAYARAIGLDPVRVAGSYMARLDQTKDAKRPGRLLGRR